MTFINRLMLKHLGIAPTHQVSIRRNVKVAMDDGIELLTDLYLGNEAAGAPVILIRSPYGRSGAIAAGQAYPFAARGFNVVMQSCRGTFGSPGKFDPLHDEQRDGLQAVEWIKQQSWYGGSIATSGMSYLGFTQWAIAAEAGPEVKAMALQVTLSDFSQMTYAGNSFSLETVFSWTNMVIRMKSDKFFILRFLLSNLFRLPLIRNEQWKTLPFASMDEKIIGARVPFWQDWIQCSSARDPWWLPISFSKSIPEIKRPISMVAGWFDIFLPWQLQDFIALRKAGCEARITIGPWRHTDSGLGRTAMQDAIDWFERHLLGEDDAPKQKPVKLYVIGAEEWCYFDEWPLRDVNPEHWYLQPQRKLLDKISPDSTVDQYRYDPADPTPALGGPSMGATPYAVDNAKLEARPDVLTYTSAPLATHRDLIGPVTAQLYVASSAPSADFFVRLCDVDGNGISKNICDGLQRVKIASAEVPQQLVIDMWPTAYRISPGHRIRVQISSGAFPRWSRNLGGTETLATETKLRSSTQFIYHSPTHPSAMILPFLNAT